MPHRFLLAYNLKKQFFQIYAAKSGEVARERYAAWKAAIPKGLHGSFADMIETLADWQAEVVASFDRHGLSSASTACLNRSVRDVDRAGRGSSFESLRARLLYGQDARQRPRLAGLSNRVNKERMPKAPLLWDDTLIARLIPGGGFREIGDDTLIRWTVEEYRFSGMASPHRHRKSDEEA